MAMDSSGHLVSTREFSTSEAALIHHIHEIAAHEKYLAVEDFSLAGWIAGALRSHVTELVVCDPCQNALISRNGNKNDFENAHKLYRLLQIGELRPVNHADVSHRVDFKIAVQQYLSLRCPRASACLGMKPSEPTSTKDAPLRKPPSAVAIPPARSTPSSHASIEIPPQTSFGLPDKTIRYQR